MEMASRHQAGAARSGLAWRVAGTLLTLVAGADLALAWNLKHPYLLAWRTFELPWLVASALAILLFAARCARERGRWLVAGLWFALGASALLVAASEEARFRAQRQAVLDAGADGRDLGHHFLVGYSDLAEVAELARRGLVAGVYLSRRNATGKSVTAIRQEIAGLQALRREAGLPPLQVVVDQEGGGVAHLSPPLPAMPSLAELVRDDASEEPLEARVRAYGRMQGAALRELGVTQNLAPVVDVPNADVKPGFDTHTRLRQRAIASDPELVTRVARAYGEGLLSQGVRPTLKHFPGLGRVAVDTHHFPGRVETSKVRLSETDWRPFRELAASGAAIMVGHVVLAAVDPARPASLSRSVVTGLLRREWGFVGQVVSDDLTMGAVYRDGIGAAAVAALNAGVDLLLVSYDPDQYFRAMAAALVAYRQGEIAAATLAVSRHRLEGNARETSRAARGV